MASLSDGISSLQQWKDFAPNLFEMTLFQNEGDSNNTITNANFFCKGFKINGAGFDLERNYANKEFFVKNYKVADTLTIEWRENADLYIYDYHFDWVTSYYNRFGDYFEVGVNPKRHATIQFQSIKETADKFTISTEFIPKFTLQFYGLIPVDLPELEGGWDRTGESVNRSITYKFDSWTFKKQ
jgi:hypothetical protein